MPDCILPTQPNNKLYNGGSEWQKDFGDLPDYYNTYYRNYDPTIGRFISTDPLAEMSSTMTTYNYANNNPIAYNDPLGDRAFPNKPRSIEEGYGSSGGGGASGRIGPGSGNYRSDGIGYSDWSSFHGSQMYRDGLAAGLTDLGGMLYRIEADGKRPHLLVHNGVCRLNKPKDDIKSRCINLVSINIFNYLIFVFSIFYMWLISSGVFEYNKLFFAVFVIALIFLLVRKRYVLIYESVIGRYKNKYSFSSFIISLLFIVIFFIPIFGIGFGIVILRQLLYNI